MNDLPDTCYVFCKNQPPGKRIAMVVRGETGCWPVRDFPDATDEEALRSIRLANEALRVDGIQAFCMKMGSMFGFHASGANPTWVRQHMPEIDVNDRSGEGVCGVQ